MVDEKDQAEKGEKVTPTPVFELRIALTVADYERIVAFYCRGLDIEPAALWTSEKGHAMLLELGRGTLEIFDENHAAEVDQIEVGQRVSGQIRFAFQVPNVDAAVARFVEQGAILIHEPIITPWGDRNARLQAPDGTQITVFEAPSS
jgi:methylmalonyl-CoA/ethylmalonyl-CoA epimerase